MSAIALTLTACNNENSTTAPEEQQKQTFSSKTMARDGEEIPELTPEEEKAVIEEAARTLLLDREDELKGQTGDAGRKALILCHTNYSAPSGHACVYNSSGYLVTVTWSTGSEQYYAGNGLYGTYPDRPKTYYSGTITPRCNC